MDSVKNFNTLHNLIKDRVPEFEVRFKDESKFMKIMGKILFFNKRFMKNFTTVIGTKVYYPSRERLKTRPTQSFRTLCHEYVHIMDYVKKPVRFSLSYLFPQILSIFAVLGVFNLWFLLFLLFLLPFPAPWRAKAEIRGYGMSCKTHEWAGECIDEYFIKFYVKQFTSPSYYYMYPFKKRVEKRIRKYLLSDDCISDINPAYRDVNYIIKNDKTI